jgi:hypothetical protein
MEASLSDINSPSLETYSALRSMGNQPADMRNHLNMDIEGLARMCMEKEVINIEKDAVIIQKDAVIANQNATIARLYLVIADKDVLNAMYWERICDLVGLREWVP